MLHIGPVTIETASYLAPILAFTQSYGMMVIGGVLVLVAFSGRRFGPLALLPLVFGLGIVLSGAAHLLPQLGH